MDFNAVCRMAGRDGDYVKSRMLDKVIEREATLLDKHYRIRQGTWANE